MSKSSEGRLWHFVHWGLWIAFYSIASSLCWDCRSTVRRLRCRLFLPADIQLFMSWNIKICVMTNSRSFGKNFARAVSKRILIMLIDRVQSALRRGDLDITAYATCSIRMLRSHTRFCITNWFCECLPVNVLWLYAQRSSQVRTFLYIQAMTRMTKYYAFPFQVRKCSLQIHFWFNKGHESCAWAKRVRGIPGWPCGSGRNSERECWPILHAAQKRRGQTFEPCIPPNHRLSLLYGRISYLASSCRDSMRCVICRKQHFCSGRCCCFLFCIPMNIVRRCQEKSHTTHQDKKTALWIWHCKFAGHGDLQQLGSHWFCKGWLQSYTRFFVRSRTLGKSRWTAPTYNRTLLAPA